MRLFVIIFSFILLSLSASGQTKSDSLTKLYLEKAKEQINLKDYKSANNYFKKIFAQKSTMPDEVAYFYGLTLVKQQNYVKGKEALEKYMTLAGEYGQYFSEADKLVEEADKHICKKCNNTGVAEVIDSCVVCKGSGKINAECDVCRSKGVELCSTCMGKGVYIVKGNFGNTYSTCQKCNGKGYTVCHQCHGTKMKSIYCDDCKGKGYFKNKKTCTHH